MHAGVQWARCGILRSGVKSKSALLTYGSQQAKKKSPGGALLGSAGRQCRAPFFRSFHFDLCEGHK